MNARALATKLAARCRKTGRFRLVGDVWRDREIDDGTHGFAVREANETTTIILVHPNNSISWVGPLGADVLACALGAD